MKDFIADDDEVAKEHEELAKEKRRRRLENKEKQIKNSDSDEPSPIKQRKLHRRVADSSEEEDDIDSEDKELIRDNLGNVATAIVPGLTEKKPTKKLKKLAEVVSEEEVKND